MERVSPSVLQAGIRCEIAMGVFAHLQLDVASEEAREAAPESWLAS